MTDNLENRFKYHAPDAERRKTHEFVRESCHDLARVLDSLPEGREKALALTKLEETMFWANAAVARQ